MSSGGSGSGGDFLARKSDATKARQSLPTVKDILIVEDETFDADRLKATLHVMLGYDIELRRASTLGSALDCVIARRPEIVFLDDFLKPTDNASQTIPFLRRAGYDGPIVVVSGQVDRQRGLRGIRRRGRPKRGQQLTPQRWRHLAGEHPAVDLGNHPRGGWGAEVER